MPGVGEPSNKVMKQTKPAQAMELRSLSPVFGGPTEASVALSDWFRKPAAPEPAIQDAVVGELLWSADDDGWSGVHDGLAFTIGCLGGSRPAEDLIAYARHMITRRDWLEAELARAKHAVPPHLAKFGDELQALRFERIHFTITRGKRYTFGELGPGRDYRAWRIEFTDDKCQGIGFDS